MTPVGRGLAAAARWAVAALTVAAGAVAGAGCAAPEAGSSAAGQALTEALAAEPGRVRLLDADGGAYALAELATPDSGTVWVQWVDLDSAAVVQVVGVADTSRAAPESRYLPGAPSPFVSTLSSDAAVARVRSCRRALAVINGAFLETPAAPPTQIAFPLKVAGRVVSGGSSPYGPGAPGSTGRRWSVPLRALILDSATVRVEPYSAADGAPLTDAAVTDAVVTYAPTAHPAWGLRTRFHVLGPRDSTTLVVLTSSGGSTIGFLAALAERLGVPEPSQVTLDGGASTFLWNRTAGAVTRPVRVPASLGPAPPGDGRYTLAHFLGVRRRGGGPGC